MAKFCQNCGTEIPPEAKVCPTCGTKLKKGIMGIIALIFAILGLIFVVAALETLPFGAIFAVTGIILGILAITGNKRKTAGIIALVLCIFALIATPFSCAIHGVSFIGKEIEKETKEKNVGTVKIGENLKIGEVRWKVLSVQKREDIGGTKPKGVFVEVHLEYEIMSKKPGSVSSSQLRIIDDKGREYETDIDGVWALGLEDKESFPPGDINPGLTMESWNAFDVAKDATGLKLKIEDLRLLSGLYGFVDLGI